MLHNDRIVYERYGRGYDERSLLNSFSIAKSVLATLVGIAIVADGSIASLADTVEKYRPEFAGTAYGTVTVRRLVTTTSGVVDVPALVPSKARYYLFAIATADAAIAIFDAKYAYNFWRPVTAIRNADLDGNDATERDATWEPLISTPMHPEYPCAHCTLQGSAASVLRVLFGDSVPTFTMTSTTALGVTRSFVRLSDYVTEVINARIFDGVHYRSSGDARAEMGRKIGEYTVENYFRPLR